MSRIKKVFSKNKKAVLNIFVTAGYPKLNSLPGILLALQEHGADIIEVGIPYSDPIADGPVIQNSNQVALGNGMTLQLLLEQLLGIKANLTVPVILMGYFNSILQYGLEKFCEDASNAGVSGVILPDMPFYEYEHLYGKYFQKHSLDVIFLISPETDKKRLKQADKLSSGFLYAVSSSATTGQNDNADTGKKMWFEKIAGLNLKNPVLIGFGISDLTGFREACRYADGAIVGSAFIKYLGENGDASETIRGFIGSLKDVNTPAS